MPHGLAFNEKTNTLFITDTSALNGRDPYNPNGTHDVSMLKLDKGGHIEWRALFARIEKGIPDGLLLHQDKLYVATGDGVVVYDLQGRVLNYITIPKGAVALTTCDKRLYITSDSGLYIYTLDT